jgi:hypothetical protein
VEVDPRTLHLSEEERIERELDDKNMKVETKAKGDGENIPVPSIDNISFC